MSYTPGESINEQREIDTLIGDYEDKLTVHFDYREWSEGHPYGDTTAYERLSECTEHWYLLNDEEVSREKLVELYGEEAVVSATTNAEERA